MNHSTEELDNQLRRLITQACSHPRDSTERRITLTKVVRAIIKSGKLWKDNDPNYGDVLQKTWLYFCENIDQYDPERGSVITWLNAYLKYRLQDIRRERNQELKTKIQHSGGQNQDLNRTIDDLINNLPAAPDIPPILEEIQQWVQTDLNGELRRIHIQGHPEITCQVLILRRLPPQKTWQILAQEFGVAASTLNSFYRRQCMPRLRKFGETQGYL